MRGSWLAISLILVPGMLVSQALAQPARHIIIISIDGLHEADLTDSATSALIPNIMALAHGGIWYQNASCTHPSDSFPGTLAYLTGAGPATTGVYYDDTFCRALVGPGGGADSPMGTQVRLTAAIDKQPRMLSGGGDFDAGSIDPAKIPLDPARHFAPVYPHNYLKVNTIFEIVHAAGRRTVLLEKHPSYEIASGPSGKGVDDMYCPEIDAPVSLIDGKLVDGYSAAAGTKLQQIIHNLPMVMVYDDMRVAALLREIGGQDWRGRARSGAPGLAVINLQTVNIAQKSLTGGIERTAGGETVSPELTDALHHADDDIASIVQKLHEAGVWNDTLIFLTAKHGNSPRIGIAAVAGGGRILTTLKAAGIDLAGYTQDQIGLYWLADSAQTDKAAHVLQTLRDGPDNPGIDQILWGDSLKAAGFSGPEDRTPDLVVTARPGMFLLDLLSKRAEHGALNEEDTHVPLILCGGAANAHRGSVVADEVKSTQIAVTALRALGLDESALQGAKAENTQVLPHSGM
jgi:Type I phosphodiesterase / nucleotide pyrophosphatase